MRHSKPCSLIMEAFTKGRSTDSGEVWISIPLQDEPQPGQIAELRLLSYRRGWIGNKSRAMRTWMRSYWNRPSKLRGPYEPVKHWSLVTQPLGLKVSQTQQTQFYRIKAPTFETARSYRHGHLYDPSLRRINHVNPGSWHPLEKSRQMRCNHGPLCHHHH